MVGISEEEIVFLPGYEIRNLIIKKEIKAKEVTEVILNRINRINPKLNAYIAVLADLALKSAEQIDEKVLKQETNSPLLGFPVSVKDLLLHIKGVPTTNGSLLTQNEIKCEDSLSVSRIKQSGGIIFGKTNVPEFGMSFATENRLANPCCNPWKKTFSSGGSSGGAAAAVASGLGAVALANDAAGSIRLPSSFCHLFGFMPSYGRVPLITDEEASSRLSCRTGVISRCVRDAAIMMNVVAQPDIRDPDVISSNVNYEVAMEERSKSITIAWCPDMGGVQASSEVIQIIENRVLALEKLGYSVEKVLLDINMKEYIAHFKNIMLADFSVPFSYIPALAKPLLSDNVRGLIDSCFQVKGSEYALALTYRSELRKKFALLMQKHDLLITPTTPRPSFPVGGLPKKIDGNTIDPFYHFGAMLFPFNITGQPAASLPCGFSKEGLPIGLQVVGAEKDDAFVFSFCHLYEQAFPWIDKYLSNL